MKKTALFLLLSFITSVAFTQVEIIQDSVSITLVKARKIKATSITWGNTAGTINSGPNYKRVQLRLKLASLNENKQMFDPNKFYYVNHTYKVRMSIGEIRYAGLLPTKAFQRLITSKPEKGGMYAYDPSVANTFLDYPFKKYKDIPVTLNFGTNRKPNMQTIYFRPNAITKNTIDVFLVVPNDFKEGSLYYGDNFIKDITFD